MKNNIITSGFAASVLLASITVNANVGENKEDIQALDFVELFEKMGGETPRV